MQCNLIVQENMYETWNKPNFEKTDSSEKCMIIEYIIDCIIPLMASILLLLREKMQI
jgi:hypothetical protein